MQQDSDIFLCPQRFEQEKQQFFLNKPQLVGFTGQLRELNSFFTAEVCGVPVVITRAADGVLRAFINSCGHRGARVANGQGCRKRLVCGFHGWAYNLDGSLGGRPAESAFAPPTSDLDLPALPVADIAGLIFVGLKPEPAADDIAGYLGKLADELSGFGYHEMYFLETRRLEVNANWKLVADLSLESYHFSVLHRNTVATVLKDNQVTDSFGDHCRWAFPFSDIEKLAQKPEEQWPDHVAGVINHAIFPATVLIQNPQDVQFIRVEPGNSPGHSVVWYSGAYKDSNARDAALEAFNFGGKVFESEDLAAARQCQTGIAAGRGRLVIGRNEPMVQYAHQRWRLT